MNLLTLLYLKGNFVDIQPASFHYDAGRICKWTVLDFAPFCLHPEVPRSFGLLLELQIVLLHFCMLTLLLTENYQLFVAGLKHISQNIKYFFIVSDPVNITECFLKHQYKWPWSNRFVKVTDIFWITHKGFITLWQSEVINTALWVFWAHVLTLMPLQVLLTHGVFDGHVGEEAFVLLLQLCDLGEQVLSFSSPDVLHQLQLLYSHKKNTHALLYNTLPFVIDHFYCIRA